MDPRDQLLATFFAETDEILAALEQLTLELSEEGNAGDAARLGEIYRLVHTLKGNASCLGFDALTQVAHDLEDVLAGVVRTGAGAGAALAELLLDTIDQLSRLSADAAKGEDRPAAAGPELAPAVPTIRVDVARLDHAMDLAGGLTVARGRLAAAIGRGDLHGAQTALGAAETLLRDLEVQILELRLLTLRTNLERFRRAVRDLGHATGKDVRLEVQCGDLEVDMGVAEALRAPLTHLLRNAVDHGIELPEIRAKQGKPREGRIQINAWHEGGQLVVEIGDDGAGMSRERLIARAAELGLAAPQDESEIWDLAFAPGLSTAEQVSDISGRGIGMDVVRRSIESLRGSVSLRSEQGEGVTVTIRLPLALSIIQGLAVRVGPEVYVLPLDSVVECVRLDPGGRIASVVGGVLEIRGDALPYLDLGPCLGVRRNATDRPSVVVVDRDGERVGLEVDELVGEVQTVIKPVGSLFAGARGVAGSAVLADGTLALVIDVRGLVRAATTSVQTN